MINLLYTILHILHLLLVFIYLHISCSINLYKKGKTCLTLPCRDLVFRLNCNKKRIRNDEKINSQLVYTVLIPYLDNQIQDQHPIYLYVCPYDYICINDEPKIWVFYNCYLIFKQLQGLIRLPVQIDLNTCMNLKINYIKYSFVTFKSNLRHVFLNV